MSNEVIMLAATCDTDKIVFPVMISEKIDGVAVDIYPEVIAGRITWSARSRQGKPIYSIPHILDVFDGYVEPEIGVHYIGELHIKGKDFKDISGLVRRDKPCDETELLQLHIYDKYYERLYDQGDETDYIKRYESILQSLPYNSTVVRRVPSRKCSNIKEFNKNYNDIITRNYTSRPTGCEGVIVRAVSGKDSWYKPGKRPKGFAKLKKTDTLDLKVIKFEEAIDAKTKLGLKMVGRIVCEYNGREIGVGPGTLTHPERKEIFRNQSEYIGRTAEVTFMPDESYDALREPRFIHWRYDK